MALRVIVQLQAKSGAGDQLLDAINEETPVTASKDGAIEVQAWRDLDDRDKFVLVEQWRDRAAYDAYLKWREESGDGALAPLLDGFGVQRYESIGEE
jgi:quinol monooxygenase YgiN